MGYVKKKKKKREKNVVPILCKYIQQKSNTVVPSHSSLFVKENK